MNRLYKWNEVRFSIVFRQLYFLRGSLDVCIGMSRDKRGLFICFVGRKCMTRKKTFEKFYAVNQCEEQAVFSLKKR